MIWAKSAKNHLSNSYYFVFPSGGHGNVNPVGQDPNGLCGYKLAKSFFADPDNKPQHNCFKALPKPNFF